MTSKPAHHLESRTGADHPAWKDDLDSVGALRRLVRLRGPAMGHDCRICGSQARHWVLVRSSDGHRSAGVRQWSVNADDYDPMCRRHRNERDPNIPRYPGMSGVGAPPPAR